MARISSELAVAAVGNKYDLVLIASRRVRELRNGWKPEISDSHANEIITALREIEQGKIGRDYLHKPTEIEDRKRKSR